MKIKPAIVRRPHVEGDWTHLHENPVLARVLAARGVKAQDDTDVGLNGLLPASTLGGLSQAVALLANALIAQQHIVIVGDYDADGATSTALAMRLLGDMGAQSVRYFVPDRFHYGYGLSTAVITDLGTPKPDLIVTVDNGVASVDGVAAARGAGIDVLVTDHHLPPEVLPNATAIVNPNLRDDPFPSKNLAGVGVVFYLLSALRTELDSRGWFSDTGIEKPNPATYLDLVALGTVADVVPLDRNNRILVEQGLRRIRAGACCEGVKALLNVAGRDYTRCVSSDLGFAVGPRLNAAGRLESMGMGIACLLADTELDAARLASQLDSMNKQRREIESDMRESANELLYAWTAQHSGQTLPAGICLYDPEWHEGVIGILAGRVRETVHRPTCVFTLDGDGMAKGSARSVAGVNIRDAIAWVESRENGLLHKYGGHAMAAGLTLAQESLPRFGELFDAAVVEQTNGAPPNAELLSDGELDSEDFTLETAALMRSALPWGSQFPEPLFDGVFTRVEQRIVGSRHLKMRVHLRESPSLVVDAIAFGETGEDLAGGDVRLAYRLDVNNFRGKISLQLLVEHIEDV
ncbi:MAG: single-stranded-DNA-specific exonuclease RecJ [Pseudomonadota bacterium]